MTKPIKQDDDTRAYAQGIWALGAGKVVEVQSQWDMDLKGGDFTPEEHKALEEFEERRRICG